MSFALFLWIGQVWPALDATRITYASHLTTIEYLEYAAAAEGGRHETCAFNDAWGTIVCG